MTDCQKSIMFLRSCSLREEMLKCNWAYFKWHRKLLRECLVWDEVIRGRQVLIEEIYRSPNSTKENDEQSNHSLQYVKTRCSQHLIMGDLTIRRYIGIRSVHHLTPIIRPQSLFRQYTMRSARTWSNPLSWKPTGKYSWSYFYNRFKKYSTSTNRHY